MWLGEEFITQLRSVIILTRESPKVVCQRCRREHLHWKGNTFSISKLQAFPDLHFQTSRWINCLTSQTTDSHMFIVHINTPTGICPGSFITCYSLLTSSVLFPFHVTSYGCLTNVRDVGVFFLLQFAPYSFLCFWELHRAVLIFWTGRAISLKTCIFTFCSLGRDGEASATVDLHTVIWTAAWIALHRPLSGKHSTGCSKCE